MPSDLFKRALACSPDIEDLSKVLEIHAVVSK